MKRSTCVWIAAAIFGVAPTASIAETIEYEPPLLAENNGGLSCFEGNRLMDAGLEVQSLKRFPPLYPERCIRNASPVETVSVLFDVGPDGKTCNIRFAATTNDCLNEAVAKSVRRWRYDKSPAGGPDISSNVTMQLR